MSRRRSFGSLPSVRRIVLRRLAATWLIVPVAVFLARASLNPVLGFVVIIALTFIWVGLALASAVWSIQYSRVGAWPLSLLTMVLPTVVLAIRPDPFVVLQPVLELGDVAHFVAAKPAYDRQIASLADDGSRFKMFYWGGMTFSSTGVVYDESDEIVLPKERRSVLWQARSRNTDLMCGTADLVALPRPLWSHYYLVGYGC